ncbi:hypothetical protein HKX48_002993, partial [Thoreauomyces humboldtii]
MRVTRLDVGVYQHDSSTLWPFAVYFTPPTTDPAFSSTGPSETGFFRLRDLDVLFFRESPGFIQRSGKVPPDTLRSSEHAFREVKRGDLFLSAGAVSDVAKKLGNYLLAEFCLVNRDQLKGGVAEEMLRSVTDLQQRKPYSEVVDDLNIIQEQHREVEEERTSGSRTAKGEDRERARALVDGDSSGPNSARPSPSKAGISNSSKSRVSEGTSSKFLAGLDNPAPKRNRSEAELSETIQSREGSEASAPGSPEAGPARPRKRLSINTGAGRRGTGNPPTPASSANSASLLAPHRHLNPAPGKSSQLSRGAEASRYNPPLYTGKLPSSQTLMSPRGGEFPSRELPFPPNLQRHHSSHLT